MRRSGYDLSSQFRILEESLRSDPQRTPLVDRFHSMAASAGSGEGVAAGHARAIAAKNPQAEDSAMRWAMR